MLAEVKVALRVTASEFDAELQDLINAAVHDLILAGVTAEKAESTTDPLIKRAVVLYCKANFGYDNPDAERFRQSYELLKAHLALAEDYTSYAITFTVTDASDQPVEGATIAVGDMLKGTNSKGVAIFTTKTKDIDLGYVVTKPGYQTAEGSVYVDRSTTVEVVLNAI